MIIKIFFPEEYFYRKSEYDIFGEVAIEENALSYFVISDNEQQHLRRLGSVGPTKSRKPLDDISIGFSYDDSLPNVYLTHLNIRSSERTGVNVFLYNPSKVRCLNCTDNSKYDGEFKDIILLNQLTLNQRSTDLKKRRFYHLRTILSFVCDSLQRLIAVIELPPFVTVLNHTTLYDHYLEWKTFKRNRKKSSYLTLDKLAGIFVMFLMFFYINQPGEYLMQTSQFIIDKLRYLLHSLKGNPIGLKLNIHLNNFFLDCFSYHIDLWATFLTIVKPIVRNLFIPIAFLGSFGLSFQLAMLSDLIALVGLHAHCFYIYAVVLYNIETIGLRVLWKVVLGKRKNPLKNRVESHDYMNRQLYLATMFFTSLLFLMPTILVYYVVFTTLRMCIYFPNALLKLLRQKILAFPSQLIVKWICGRLYEIDGIEIEYLTTQLQAVFNMTVFRMNIKSSSPKKIFSSRMQTEDLKSDILPLKEILYNIIHGKVFNLK